MYEFLSDPTINGLILGVLGNILTDLVKFPVKQFRKKQKSSTQSLRIEAGKPENIIQKSLENYTETAEFDEERHFEELILFLQSEEVANVIRQMFGYYIYEEMGDEPRSTITGLRSAFIYEYNNYFEEYSQKLSIDALRELFDKLTNATEIMFSNEVQSGNLAAHDALDKFRHLQQMGQLHEIQKEIKRLKRAGEISVKKILEFEKAYREQVLEIHGRIMPPSFGDTRKVPIDKIYVTPFFFAKDSHYFRFIDGEPTGLYELIEDIEKTLILGNPGAGKTTLTDKLCYELSAQYGKLLIRGKRLTPVHIILRKYSEEKKKQNCSIADFIEQTLNSRYQIKPPLGTVDYMLINGRAIVIFDGLDELLEVGHRREIVTDIEAFMRRYPLSKVLVTSREVGYRQAPLEEGEFTLYKIAPFTEEQVIQYVEKWFSSDVSLSEAEKEMKTTAFLKESGKVPELRSNPLMLSLMCLIYKGEGYIPSNRPDLYEKCSKMLFETWDRGRSIESYKPFEHYFSATLMNIAFWIYSEEVQINTDDPDEDEFNEEEFDNDEFWDEDVEEEGQKGGVTGFNEKLIVKIAADYLEEYFENRHKAEAYAHDLIEFCKNRAWVFTDVGEDLYNFTHRTFLEYYTAQYLVRTYTGISELVDFLFPKIEKNEWFLVAQLAIQIKNQTYERAADKIIDSLIERSKQTSPRGREQVQIFICNCLEFINLRRQTRENTFSYVETLMLKHVSQVEIGKSTSGSDHLRSLFGELSKSNYANKDTINSLIEKFIEELWQSGSEKKRKYAVLLATDLPHLQNKEFERKDTVWSEMPSSLLEKLNISDLYELCAADLEVSLNCSDSGMISPLVCISAHGADYLLNAAALIYTRRTTKSLISLILKYELSPQDALTFTTLLKEIGKCLSKDFKMFLIHKESEYVSFQIPSNYSDTHKSNVIKVLSESDVDSELFMGIFWLYALLWEFKEIKRLLIERTKGTFIEKILACRSQGREVKLDTHKLDAYKLSDSQKQLVVNWAEKRFNFGI